MTSSGNVRKGRILVVDDQPINLEMLTQGLVSYGYEVQSARDGNLAMSVLPEFAPDLILLDILMPGMDGYEVCRLLKADPRYRDIPIVFLSALAEPIDKVKGIELGGVDYLTKPFDFQEVRARVEKHLALRDSQRDLEARIEERTGALVAEIAERKRAEEALRQSEAAEREQRILAEALLGTMAALTSTLDVDTVMRAILDKVTLVVPSDYASITLFDNAGTARIAHARNFPPEAVTFFNDFRFRVDQSAFGAMFRSGKPCLIADTQAYPEWVDLPALPVKTRAYLGVPIQIHGGIVGAINLDSVTPGFFTDKQARWLQAFADQAAIAIENARLYAALQEYATDLERRVRERTQELDQERAHLQAILEGMAEGVLYIAAPYGLTRYINPAFTELTGRGPEEFINQSISACREILDSPDEYERLAEVIRAGVREQNNWRGTLKGRRKDGLPLELSLTVSIVAGTGAQPAGVVVLARDVGPEKALQAQKDRFIASAAHELRTPITNLKLRLYLARRQPERAEEHLAVVEDIADYVTNLVEALLEVSRFERGVITLEQKHMPLQDVLRASFAECQLEAERKHIQLLSEWPTEPLSVFIDPVRVRQVVDNLIVNAIHYTPEHGQITVRAEPSTDATWAILRIRDTGIGIAPEDVPHLFEPFYRAANVPGKGMGLGLTIAKDVIDLHGGTITVESQQGQGSTFCVRLPLSHGS